MAKESGIAHYLFVDGRDLSGDIGSVDTISTIRAPLDVTGIDKSAVERILGLSDASMSFNAWFNPSTDQAHHALGSGAITLNDRLVSYYAGADVGDNCFNLVGKQIDYKPARAADGALAVTVDVQGAAGGIGFWCDALTTGKQTFASATNGTGLDYGATIGQTTFGAVAFLQAFSIASGTATVAVQDSADGSSWANVTGLVFTAVTARTTERLATATNATIRRHMRVNLTGTFTNCVIAVGVQKFLVAQS